MHPIRNFAADDRSPELQVSNLSTISSADRIFIHHVLLKGKDRHLLGSAMVRHTVPPCSTIYTSPRFVKGSVSNLLPFLPRGNLLQIEWQEIASVSG